MIKHDLKSKSQTVYSSKLKEIINLSYCQQNDN